MLLLALLFCIEGITVSKLLDLKTDFKIEHGLCAPGCKNSMLGDNECNQACLNHECNFDRDEVKGRADCEEYGFVLSDEECVPGCPTAWLGDGICDAPCNVPQCNFDGEARSKKHDC